MNARSLTVLVALALAAPGLVVLSPAAQAATSVRHVDVVSFDQTKLSATVFLPDGASPASPVPFVLMTHGWGGSRATSPTDARVAALLGAGYGVLTWDSRGFGTSGGKVMLDSPDFEVKDVSVLIDHLVANEPVLLNAGDPVIGMSGVSYAGGIQLLAAAHDERIDVITPEITWNDLSESLAPNGVPKFAWIDLLFGAGLATSCQTGFPDGCVSEDLAKWYAEVMATNAVSPTVKAELLKRSPKTYMDRIDVPTLLIQGFPDTLFDVNQAVANYEGIKANGAPVKLWLYDGGHILPHEGAGTNTQDAARHAVVVRWLDCHLKGVAPCDTGPEVEWYSTDGVWRSAAQWPVTQAAKSKNGYDGLSFVGEVGRDGTGMFDLETALVPTIATGNAHVKLTVLTTGPSIFFVSLGIREGAQGKVVRVAQQNQPLRVDGTTLTNVLETDLVSVSPVLQPGQTLVLVVQSFDPDYNNERTPGAVIVSRAAVTWQSAPAS